MTQGGHGGLLVTTVEAGPGEAGPGEVLRYLPTPTDGEVDPTGAGDTFLAALLATLIRPDLAGPAGGPLARGLRFAAAAGSLAVEGIGLAGVPDMAAVLERRSPGACPPDDPAQPVAAGRRRGSATVGGQIAGRAAVGAGPVEPRTCRSTGRRTRVGTSLSPDSAPAASSSGAASR